jgi:heme iron utilization protein
MDMSDTTPQKIDPIRPTSPEAIRMAQTLMRTAHFGALAVLDPASGTPLASRVAVATAMDGATTILVSELSNHTQALRADPRCSILLGEPGKGDALAHPRVTIICGARFLSHGTSEANYARARYLRRNPKAQLYVDFGDFSFVRLEPERSNLNGGFGKAFRLTGQELLDDDVISSSLEPAEQTILDDMNANQSALVNALGRQVVPTRSKNWTMTGIDSGGVDLYSESTSIRSWFNSSIVTYDGICEKLRKMAVNSDLSRERT